MKQKITLKNISSFIEGNTQLILEEFRFQPLHIQEQIVFRRLVCKDDCAVTGLCIVCGCHFLGKSSVRESCNKERFPDLMSKNEWEQYKKKNDIT